MALNAFMSLGKAKGESIQRGFEDWIEVQAWGWGIEADTSWTKGGGASVGKPYPGKMNWEHYFDSTSPQIMGYICSGKAFPEAILKMCKAGDARPEPHFTATMKSVFITRVASTTTPEGNLVQKVEMVFKHIRIEYRRQKSDGSLLEPISFEWDIPNGAASPSS
jgi:type VI secretion system secreted protein Hcp